MTFYIDILTLNAINAFSSVIFSILILLIRTNFKNRYKGTVNWFMSFILPAISFGLLISSEFRTLTLPMFLMSLSFSIGNLELRIGWKKFYNRKVNNKPEYGFTALFILISLAVSLDMVVVSIIMSIFNLLIIGSIALFVLRKYREKHEYSNLTIVLINLTAFLVLLPAMVINIRNPETLSIHHKWNIFLLTFGIMTRNILCLFSIFIAVLHQFKVDQDKIIREKEQLLKNLEILSVTDELTGLLNRRGFDDLIHYEFIQSKRRTTGFTITLCDIDLFKKVNDTYGHDCGDMVIKAVAKKIRDSIREQDCLARWGGEEYIILQPNSDTETTHTVMERVRKSIEHMSLQYGNHSIRITLSFGIAELKEDSTNYDSVIIEADTKLYQAKQSGRNCIAF